jgi:hypothetical protein
MITFNTYSSDFTVSTSKTKSKVSLIGMIKKGVNLYIEDFSKVLFQGENSQNGKVHAYTIAMMK